MAASKVGAKEYFRNCFKKLTETKGEKAHSPLSSSQTEDSEHKDVKFCDVFEELILEEATPNPGQTNVKNENADDSSETRNQTKAEQGKKLLHQTWGSKWNFEDFAGYVERLEEREWKTKYETGFSNKIGKILEKIQKSYIQKGKVFFWYP